VARELRRHRNFVELTRIDRDTIGPYARHAIPVFNQPALLVDLGTECELGREAEVVRVLWRLEYEAVVAQQPIDHRPQGSVVHARPLFRMRPWDVDEVLQVGFRTLTP